MQVSEAAGENSIIVTVEHNKRVRRKERENGGDAIVGVE